MSIEGKKFTVSILVRWNFPKSKNDRGWKNCNEWNWRGYVYKPLHYVNFNRYKGEYGVTEFKETPIIFITSTQIKFNTKEVSKSINYIPNPKVYLKNLNRDGCHIAHYPDLNFFSYNSYSYSLAFVVQATGIVKTRNAKKTILLPKK